MGDYGILLRYLFSKLGEDLPRYLRYWQGNGEVTIFNLPRKILSGDDLILFWSRTFRKLDNLYLEGVDYELGDKTINFYIAPEIGIFFTAMYVVRSDTLQQ
jgi:hypothetical protein